MLRALRPNTYKAHMPRLSSEFYDFQGAEDELAAHLLATHITRLVHRARKKTLVKLICPTYETEFQKNLGGNRQWWSKLLSTRGDGVSVYLPHDFVPRVVRDVIRMSEGEAHGIRGCTLALEVRDGTNRVSLGKIVCDPKVPTTCTLHVRMARASPPPQALSSNSFLNLATIEDIYISPGYTLEKTRRKQSKNPA
ncbi:protein charybde-like [Macrobrachium rosenbergii]|uniref:protein charybde-like n=1 Tax=Macrobrachium rosenbergii TaxID=79674 RepID=UPI0034D6EB16